MRGWCHVLYSTHDFHLVRWRLNLSNLPFRWWWKTKINQILMFLYFGFSGCHGCFGSFASLFLPVTYFYFNWFNQATFKVWCYDILQFCEWLKRFHFCMEFVYAHLLAFQIMLPIITSLCHMMIHRARAFLLAFCWSGILNQTAGCFVHPCCC